MINLSHIGISVQDDVDAIQDWYFDSLSKPRRANAQHKLMMEMLRRHKNNVAHFGYRSYLLTNYDTPLAVFINLSARDLAIMLEVHGLFECYEDDDDCVFAIATMEGQQLLHISKIGPRGFIYLCSRFNKKMISLLKKDEELMEHMIEDILEDV